MTALSFKARFAGPVERREKRQSIREHGDRFKVGLPIQLYTGMRTKACRKLVADDPVCRSVEPVTITREYTAIGDWRLASGDLIDFVRADGFKSIAEFHLFFLDGRERFDGFLIKWGWPE